VVVGNTQITTTINTAIAKGRTSATTASTNNNIIAASNITGGSITLHAWNHDSKSIPETIV
jgi:hypothetical protein